MSQSICCYTEISFFSPKNTPIFFGCILWHNITWGVNWNLVKHKNLKPHKILQSYWYGNYLADFIYSCKQHNLTSNGYVTCLHHFTLPNRNFCCNSGNFPLPSMSISKPTAMAIGSKRCRFFHQKWQGSSHSFKNTVFLTVSPQITCTPVNYPLYFLQAHETAPELQSGRHREGNFTSFLWVICILHVQKYSMNFIICLIYTFIHKKSHTWLMSIYLNITFCFSSKKPLQWWFVTFSSLQITYYFITLLSSENKIILFLFLFPFATLHVI